MFYVKDLFAFVFKTIFDLTFMVLLMQQSIMMLTLFLGLCLICYTMMPGNIQNGYLQSLISISSLNLRAQISL